MNNTTIKTGLATFALFMGFAPILPAVETIFTGTGNWSDTTKWTAGVPQSGDYAVIRNDAHATIDGDTVEMNRLTAQNNTTLTVLNGASVTVNGETYAGSVANRTSVFGVTNSAMRINDAYIGRTAGGDIKYFQKGGSLVHYGSNFYLYGNSAVRFVLEDVTANFEGTTLWVGCGLSGNGEAGASMEFKNSVVRQADRLWIGRTAPGNADATPSHGKFVISGGAWTNVSGNAIFVGEGPGSVGHLVLSNCVFKTTETAQDNYEVILGSQSGSTGRVDVFETEVNLAHFFVPYTAGAAGTLALHGWTLTSWPTFSHANGIAPGGDTTLELVDGTFDATSYINIGAQNVFGTSRLHVKGGTLSAASGQHILVGKNNTTDGGTSAGHLILDGATSSCSWLIAGRNSNHPGFIDALNGSSISCNRLYAGYENAAVGTITLGGGTTVKCREDVFIGNGAASIGALTNLGAKVSTGASNAINVGYNAGAKVWYRDGAESMTVTPTFRVPYNGTAVAEIGGTVASTNFQIGRENSYTGEVTVVEGALIDATNTVCVGVKDKSGVAKLELRGGIVLAPYVRRLTITSGATPLPNSNSYVYFNGGTLKARKDQASDWIASDFTETAISDGGAIFDSNGYTVYSAASFTHDSRTGAAAKDGGIVKKGAGTVALTGSLSFTGDIRVEAGILDLSHATYTMGASAGLSGSGTLKAPAAGLSCGGKVLLDASRGTLTVDGDLALGATATVEAENPDTLDRNRSYTILSATSIAGTPAVSGLGDGWHVSNTGTTLRLSFATPTTIILR